MASVTERATHPGYATAGHRLAQPGKLAGLVLQVHGEHAQLVLLCPRHGVLCFMRPALCPGTCSASRVGIGVESAADAPQGGRGLRTEVSCTGDRRL